MKTVMTLVLAFTSAAHSVGFYRDSCEEKRAQVSVDKDSFEECIKKGANSKGINSETNLLQKCSDELTHYTTAVVNLKSCLENMQLHNAQ